MTESQNPYSNAFAKGLTSILKHFLEVYNEKVDVLKLMVTEAISIYNTKHAYLYCQIKTPNEMHPL